MSQNTSRVAEPSDARLAVRLSQAESDIDLLKETVARLEAERRRLERELLEGEAERASLLSRLGERERYLRAIHSSAGWKLLQRLRGLLGRRW